MIEGRAMRWVHDSCSCTWMGKSMALPIAVVVIHTSISGIREHSLLSRHIASINALLFRPSDQTLILIQPTLLSLRLLL